MEAMGLRPEDHEPPKHKQSRMATDDMVSKKDNRYDELLLTEILGHGAFQEAYAKVRPYRESGNFF
jgi:hypothetical protein